MKPASLIPLLLGAVVTCALAEAPEYTGDVKDVRLVRAVEQHPGASLVWEPYIAAWKPKQLVVAYGAGIPGKVDMGDIYASVSTNDGDTWSEPAFIFDHNQRFGAMQFGYANPVLYKPPGQDVIWCYAMRCPMNYHHSEDSQLVGAFSADGGRSWTPVEMAMQYTGPLIIVAGIQSVIENGHPLYLLPAHRNTLRSDPLGSRDQFMLSSTSLLDWKLAGHIPQPESGRVFLHEGNLAPGDGPGELKLVMRTATYDEKGVLDPPRAFSSVSKDNGRTWTPAKQEPDLWNARSKAFYGQSANGTHLYIYNDGPPMPKPGGRTSLRYKLQPTPGGPWSGEKTFYDSGTHNSYPTLIEVAPNDFRAVWDSGTKERARTQIHFGKFRLPADNK
jgi:hypothetical protein